MAPHSRPLSGVLGDETVERPLTSLLGPDVLPPAARWLSRWLLFAAAGSGALAVASIVLALLHGVVPVAWQAGLLVFDLAVIVFLLRHALLAATPLWAVCWRTFSGVGLVASSYAILTVVVSSVMRFLWGQPSPEVLVGLAVFGLLGLAGWLVFWQCLRGAAWACRTAVLGAAAFVVVLAAQPLAGYWFFVRRAPTLGPTGHWPALAAACACAAGLAMFWRGRVRRTADRAARLWTAVAAAWFVGFAGAVALATHTLVLEQGLAAAYTGLWQTAAWWAAAGLAPLAVGGAVVSWRRCGTLAEDARGATAMIWTVVALGGIAGLALWLPARLGQGGLGFDLVVGGVLAGMAGAWLSASRGGWARRWALLPTAVLVAALLAALGRLLGLAAPLGAVWTSLTAFLWCCLVAGFALGLAGLYVMRRDDRPVVDDSALWGDAGPLSALGLAGSLTLLWALAVCRIGSPSAVAELARVLGACGGLARDVVTLSLGASAVQRLVSAHTALAEGLTGNLAGAAALVLAVAAGVHLLGAVRVRWAAVPMAGVWLPMAAALTLVTLASASRVFFPMGQAGIATALGARVAGSFPARLAFTAVLVAVTVRLWEASAALLRLCAPQEEVVVPLRARLEREGEPDAWPRDGHLTFLIRAGCLAGAVGLVAAVVLSPLPEPGLVLLGVAELGREWGGRALAVAWHAGRLAVRWPGYAAAAAAVLYFMAAVADECRRGRAAAYPLVGALWVAVLSQVVVGWIRLALGRPAPAGTAMLGLSAVAVLLVVALVALARLWLRWWELAGRSPARAADLLDPEPGGSATYGLGSLTLALCVVGGAVAVLGALSAGPAWRAHLAAAGERSAVVTSWVLRRFAEATAGWRPEDYQVASAVLAAASLGLLAVHLLAQRPVRALRAMLVAVWSGIALVAAVLLGYGLGRAWEGSWDLGELAGLLVLALLLARILAALGNAHAWLVRRA